MMSVYQTLKTMPMTAKLGVVIILLNIIAVIFAPVLAPYGETEVVGKRWQPTIWTHDPDNSGVVSILGTDHLGRDLFSRLLYGARNTISLAVITSLIACSVGVFGGLFSVARGGWIDQIVSRAIDVLMGLPALIFALLVLSVVGTSIFAMVGVTATLEATRVFRVSRAIALDINPLEFIEAARIRGEGTWWIITREYWPNAIETLLTEFGLRFCYVFLFISSLSFLGLGIQPPTAEWGSMLRENATAISFGIMTPLFPAAAVMLLAVGVNLVVDWLSHKSSGLEKHIPRR